MQVFRLRVFEAFLASWTSLHSTVEEVKEPMLDSRGEIIIEDTAASFEEDPDVHGGFSLAIVPAEVSGDGFLLPVNEDTEFDFSLPDAFDFFHLVLLAGFSPVFEVREDDLLQFMGFDDVHDIDIATGMIRADEFMNGSAEALVVEAGIRAHQKFHPVIRSRT